MDGWVAKGNEVGGWVIELAHKTGHTVSCLGICLSLSFLMIIFYSDMIKALGYT